MSVSGLITEGIFTLLRAVPPQHNMVMGSKHYGLNATTILNGIALILAIAIYYFYKNPPASVSNEFAEDPICGMQVRKSDAPASYLHEGAMYYFCMDGCKEAFISKKPSNA
jgi:YHS domain-containing protein